MTIEQLRERLTKLSEAMEKTAFSREASMTSYPDLISAAGQVHAAAERLGRISPEQRQLDFPIPPDLLG